MSLRVSTKKIITSLMEERSKILITVNALPDEQREVVFLGIWSVMDLLAHFVGWDYTNIEAIKSILSDKVPDFFTFYDEDWRTFNDRLVTQYKVNEFDQLVEAAKKSHRELIELLHTVSYEEFYKDRGLRNNDLVITIADLLETELNDEREHYRQIAEFIHEENTPV